MSGALKKEEWDLVSFRLHPAICHAVAQALKKAGVSRPVWLTAAVEKALADQDVGK
ncbi:hypothetical protein [Mesorhizobium sp. M1272]|uniref:hypothetical protein n=1 Tax=Mesorhizobium sp. M1272 TaxID=2957074 RepID=UPI003338FD93